MQERDLFEYAVIRVVPKVEREEFLNVGVILFCARQKFLQAKCQLDNKRIQAVFGSGLDLEEIWNNLKAVERISLGEETSGPIAQLDLASRFRWLTATRSTIVQTSKVHPGFCKNAAETLERLFRQLVL